MMDEPPGRHGNTIAVAVLLTALGDHAGAAAATRAAIALARTAADRRLLGAWLER